MKRRPVCTGAVLLIVILMFGRCFGAPEACPFWENFLPGREPGRRVPFLSDAVRDHGKRKVGSTAAALCFCKTEF